MEKGVLLGWDSKFPNLFSSLKYIFFKSSFLGLMDDAILVSSHRIFSSGSMFAIERRYDWVLPWKKEKWLMHINVNVQVKHSGMN